MPVPTNITAAQKLVSDFITTTVAENERLKAAAASNPTTAQVTSLKAEIATLKTQVVNLTATNATQTSQITTLTTQNRSCAETNSRLTGQIATYQAKIAALEASGAGGIKEADVLALLSEIGTAIDGMMPPAESEVLS